MAKCIDRNLGPIKTFNIPVSKPEWLTDENITSINDRNKFVGLFKQTECLDFLILSKYLHNKLTRFLKQNNLLI